MKKHIIFCLAALSALASCNKEELIDPGTVDTGDYSGLEFTASFAPKDSTKTTLETDGRTVKWHPSDAIKILPAANEWGYTSIPAVMKAISEDKKTATFAAEEKEQIYTPAFAVYPGSIVTSLCEGEESLTHFKMKIPTSQDGSFSAANIAAAKCDGGNLTFKNSCGIFKIRFHSTTGTTLKIHGTNIAGTFKLSFPSGSPVLTDPSETSDDITVTNVEYNTDYYVAVAPGNYAAYDLSFTVKDKSGVEVVSTQYVKDITVTPGMLVDWADIADHVPGYLPEGYSTSTGKNPFREALYELGFTSDNTKKITFEVNSTEPKQEGEILMDETGAPVYASGDLAAGFVTIRTSGPEFRAKSGIAGMYRWFGDMTNLTEISGFENINTSAVIAMDYLFKRCGKLEKINFDKFDTHNVMSFDGMFMYCDKLPLDDLSFLNTESAVGMRDMFSSCTGMVNVDISGFDMAGVKYMTSMFYGCTSLETIILPDDFVPSSCEDVTNLFRDCEKLKYLDGSKFNFSKVHKMESMLEDCEVLKDLDVSSWDAPRCLYMKSLFKNCASLENLNFENFTCYSSNRAESMFQGCTNLKSVKLPKFAVGKSLYTAKSMFQGCTKLTTLEMAASTKNVTDMSYMFAGCESLTSVDLSFFKTSNVTDFSGMFSGASRVGKLVLGSDFTISNTAKDKTVEIFGPSDNLMGHLNGSDPYTDITCRADTWSQLTAMLGDDVAHYQRKIKAYLPTGEQFNERILDLRPGTDPVSILFYTGSEVTEGGTIINPGLNVDDPTIYAKMTEGGNVSVWTSGDMMSLNADSEGMFADFTEMTSISGLECLSATDVATMKNMFTNCYGLETIPGLDKWKAMEVTSLSAMFAHCESLQSLPDLSGFNSASLTDLSMMFYGCPALTTPNGLGSWNTSAVTDMSDVFGGCTAMTDFSFLPEWDTSSCTDMSDMFSGAGATQLDVSNFNTSNVTNMKGMFSWLDVTTLDVSGFNTSKVTDMSEMFSYCMKLTSLDVSGFDTRAVGNFTEMFCGCNKAALLNTHGENFVIDAAATLTGILGTGETNYLGCKNGVPYATIKISAENLGLVTAEMGSAMDYYVFDTPANMPTGPTFQTLIGNLSREKGIYPTTVNFLVQDARSTSGAVLVNGDCEGLGIYMSLNSDGRVDVWTRGGGFILNANSAAMFHSTPTVGDEAARCQKVTAINGMDKWNTSAVTTMETMFYHCQDLVTYDFTHFDTSNVTSMAGMFAYCSKMPSFSVTTWDTSNVTTMYRMFSYCQELMSIELNTFNTSNVTSMAQMFSGCLKLASVNISGFDTGKVESMKSMFNGCINLGGINLGSKFVFEGINTDYMFYDLGTNRSIPYCTFSCYGWQKSAITGILGSEADNYAFSIK